MPNKIIKQLNKNLLATGSYLLRSFDELWALVGSSLLFGNI